MDVASAGRLALLVSGTALQSASALNLSFEDGTILASLASSDGGPLAAGGSYVFTWVVESQDNGHTQLIADAGVAAGLGLNVHLPAGGTVLWDHPYACSGSSCRNTDTELASVAIDADAGLLYAVGRADITSTDPCDGGADHDAYLLAASTADGHLIADVLEGSVHPGGEGADLALENNDIFQVGSQRLGCRSVGYIEYRAFVGTFGNAQQPTVYGDGGADFYFDQLALDSDGTLLVSGHTPDATSGPTPLLVGFGPTLVRTRDVSYTARSGLDFGYPLAVDTSDESVWQGWDQSSTWNLEQVYRDGGLANTLNVATSGRVLGLVADAGGVYACGFVTASDGGGLASALWSQPTGLIQENVSAQDDACLGLAIDPRGNLVTVDRENRASTSVFGTPYTFRVRGYDASWSPQWMSQGEDAGLSHYDGAVSPTASAYHGHHMAIDADGFIYGVYNQGGQGHIVKISP